MTLSELATLALRDLGVIAASESPSTADGNFVEDKLTRAHERLVELGLVSWTITTVPDYAIDAFVAYAIPSFANAFGVPTDTYASEQVALRRVRELVADRRINEPGRADYF